MIIDIGCNILLDFRTDPECLFVIDSQNDIQLIILQKRRDCLSCRQQRQVFGKTVNPGCADRKDNSFSVSPLPDVCHPARQEKKRKKHTLP